MALAKNAPVWRHLGGECCSMPGCGLRIQVMEVAFQNGPRITLKICPRCDRLEPNPNLL